MKNEPLERLAGVSRAKLSKNRSAKVGAAEETVMTNKSRDGQGAKTAPQGKDQPAPPAADLAEPTTAKRARGGKVKVLS